MKKTIKTGLWLFVLLIVLSACTEPETETEATPEIDIKMETPYSKSNLTIGVVGKAPGINTDNIELKEITINDLAKETVKDMDGVLVMEDQLAEASKSKYVKLYQEADIPFFFMGSKMGMAPFLDENMAYDEESSGEEFESYYAYGFHMTKDGTLKNWTFGLHDNKETSKNIQNVITRIFKIIGGEQIDTAIEPK